MKKTFKKSLALFLTFFMIVTAVPLTAINVFAESKSGTLSYSDFGLIRSGDTSRMESGTKRLNIVNDGEGDSTSAGIIKYDISAYHGFTIENATVNVKVDNDIDEDRPTGYYYSYDVSSAYLGQSEHKESISTGSYYTGRNSMLKLLAVTGSFTDGEGGKTAPNFISEITNKSTAVHNFDVTNIVQGAICKNKSAFYLIIVKNEAGQSGSSGGWTDTWITPASQTLSISGSKEDVAKNASGAETNLNNFSYTAPTGEYASFAGDKTQDFASGKTYTDYMRNMLWGEKLTSFETEASNARVNNISAYLKYPQAVLLYDGTHDLDSPVLLQTTSNTNSERKIHRAYVTSEGITLVNMDHWAAADQSDNWAWLYSNDISNDQDPTGVTSDKSSWISAWNYKNKYYRYANMFRFSGSFNSGEYLKTIYPAVSANVDGGTLNITGGHALYYVNYKVLLDTVEAAKTYIQTVKENEWKYTSASLNAYIDAVAALTSFNFNDYSFGSNIDSEANALANGIKSVVEGYNNAKNGLEYKKSTVTFRYVDGTTVQRIVTAGDELDALPKNTSPKYNDDRATHSVYGWTPTIDADATHYGNGAVYDGQLIVKSCTIMEIVADNGDCNFGETVTESTCSALGNTHYLCDICGGSYDVEIAMKAHKNDDPVTENEVTATCSAAGSYDTVVYCTVCGQEVSRTTTPVEKLAHTWVEKTVISAPTCTAKGSSVFECSVCHTEETFETDIVDHTPEVIPAVEPTCQHSGNHEGSKCKVCGLILEEAVELGQKSHKYGTYVSDGNATCAQDGTKTAECQYGCGTKNTITEVGSKANVTHTPGEATQTNVVASTCTVKGSYTEVIKCSVCDITLSTTANKELPLADHTPEEIPAVAPTCTAKGSTAGSKCSVCGTVLVAPTEEAMIAHNYVAVVTDPTCTADGYTTYTCSECGDNYTADSVNKTGHSPYTSAEAVAATCTSVGYTAETSCSVCHEVIVAKTEIAKIAHTEETIPAVAATCTSTGLTAGKKCSVCQTITVPQTEVAKKAHDYNAVVTAATCTTDGYTTYTCKNCDDTYVGNTVTAPGHTWNAGTVTTEATCTAKGEKSFECTVCHETKTEEIAIDSSNHTGLVTDPAVAATCTTTGKTEGSHCTACGNTVVAQTTVAKLAHPWNDGTVTTAATCVATGVKTYTCTVCAATKTEDIAIDSSKHADIKTLEAVAATCSATGLTEGKKCEACDTVITAQTEVAKTAHTWNAGEVTTAATCVATGVKTYECTVCHETKTEDIAKDASNHTNVVTLEAKAATCSATGLTEGKKCEACGTVITAQTEVAKTAHTWDAGEVTTVATCVAKGVKTYECTVCHETKTEDIAKDASNHTNVVTLEAKAATCSATGLTEGKKCEACGTVITAQTTVEKIAHTEETLPAVAATCTSTGLTEGKKCSICGLTLVAQTVVAKAAHTEETLPAVAATCSATGLTAGKKCSVCDEILVAQTEVAKLAHTSAAAVKENEVAATCETDGSYDSVVYCSVCSAELSRTPVTVPAKGHEDANGDGKCDECNEDMPNCVHANTTRVDAVDATCTKAGYTGDLICDDCGVIVEASKLIPLKGHTQEIIPAVAATCTKKGLSEGKKCSVCGKILVEQKETPIAHTLETVAGVAPTCTSEGSTETVFCTVCGTIVVKPQAVAKIAHVDNNDDGKCDVCGTGMQANCDCICHKRGVFAKFIYKILRFFWKLFGIGKSCSCGYVHY